MLFDKPNAAIQKLFIYEDLSYIFLFLVIVSLVSYISTKFLKMDLMRFIQNLQECKSPMKPTPFENNDKFKEIYQQHHKENQIKSLQEKVDKLNVNKTETENSDLDLVRKYEDLIKTVMEENDNLREDRKVANIHIENLEKTIKELLEKFKWAKNIIKGFESNEKILKTQLEKYKTALISVETKLIQSEESSKVNQNMSRISSANKCYTKFKDIDRTSSRGSVKNDSNKKYPK